MVIVWQCAQERNASLLVSGGMYEFQPVRWILKHFSMRSSRIEIRYNQMQSMEFATLNKRIMFKRLILCHAFWHIYTSTFHTSFHSYKGIRLGPNEIITLTLFSLSFLLESSSFIRIFAVHFKTLMPDFCHRTQLSNFLSFFVLLCLFIASLEFILVFWQKSFAHFYCFLYLSNDAITQHCTSLLFLLHFNYHASLLHRISAPNARMCFGSSSYRFSSHQTWKHN